MPAVLAEDCLQNFCDKRNTGQEGICASWQQYWNHASRAELKSALQKGAERL